MHKASCVREREARGARCLSDCAKHAGRLAYVPCCVLECATNLSKLAVSLVARVTARILQ